MAFAQAVDTMQPGPGERAGALGKGEPLVSALSREKIEPSSARKAIKSLTPLFDPKHARTGDRYVYQVGAGRKLTLLRYQRAKHIFEIRLTETGEYVSRLMLPGENPQPQDMAIHPPQTEGVEEEDVERRAVMGEDAPVPTEIAEVPAQAYDQPTSSVLDDVRADEDFAPLDAPPQPIDPVLAGLPNPDELPMVTEPPQSGDQPAPDAEAPGPSHEGVFPKPIGEPDALAQPAPSAKDTGIAPYETPQIIPLPAKPTPVPRPDHLQPYAPMSLVIACLGLIALIAGILLSVLPAWRARQNIAASGLHIEDEIYISNGQRLALVSDGKHHYLVSSSKTAVQLLACCDDDEETQRAWSFFKRKTYWHQLGSKPVNNRQLKELVDAFNQHDSAFESKDEQPATQEETKVSESVAPSDKQLANVTTSPTLPGILIPKAPQSHAADDDHETLEVPELPDGWFTR